MHIILAVLDMLLWNCREAHQWFSHVTGQTLSTKTLMGGIVSEEEKFKEKKKKEKNTKEEMVIGARERVWST